MQVFVIIVIIITVVLSIAGDFIQRRCPRCKKWFARRLIKKSKYKGGHQRLGPSGKRVEKRLFECSNCRYRWAGYQNIDRDKTW
jgi:hypothetical protein